MEHKLVPVSGILGAGEQAQLSLVVITSDCAEFSTALSAPFCNQTGDAFDAMPGEYYQFLPIVALTANAMYGTREMMIGQGMSDYLAKPIELNKLDEIVRRWIPAEKHVNIK